MTSKSASAGGFSFRRWSQRKLAAARAGEQAPPIAAASPPPAAPQESLTPADAERPAEMPLPPIESLTLASDFTPFFKREVDETIKRAALKQLLRDPRFNIMDGLDTYIDDYTQPDPIPAAMLEGLMQRRVSFALPEAEEATATPVASGADRNPAARGAEAIPPLPARIEPVPRMPIDRDPDEARDTAHSPPEGVVTPPTGKP